MTIDTCTKVNIGLHVMRRRPDGYHDLETLFVPYYGFGDRLTIEPAAQTAIEIIRPEGVDWDPQQDLTIRAWRLLKADYPQLPCVHIRLEKHAPVGAGLGGGSADAAFALKLLRDIGSLPLSDAGLSSYAARLGSDCCFFILMKKLQTIPLHPQGTEAPNIYQPMYATGRGEILTPFDIDLSGYELRVEIPLDAETGSPVAVSTREAYSEVVPRDRWEQGQTAPLAELLATPVEQWKDCIVNDFEKGVFAKHPEIAALKQKFYDSGAIYAAMSGSGSAVFGLFRK